MIPKAKVFREIKPKENKEEKVKEVNTIELNEDKAVESINIPNYEVHEKVLLAIAVDKNHIFRIVDEINGRFVDIRKFYKGFPTKNGIRVPLAIYKEVNKLIDEKIVNK